MKKIGFLFITFMLLSVSLSFVSAQTDDKLDLALQQPKLREIPAYVFNMTNLRELDLEGNRIGVIPRDILKLRNLEVLTLSGNLYLTALPDFLMDMESLKTIYFEGMRTWSQAKKDAAVRKFAQRGIKVILSQQYHGVTDQE